MDPPADDCVSLTPATGTELEVLRVLQQRLHPVSTDGGPQGKVAMLREAEASGIPAEDLGTFVATISDHPWSVTLRACTGLTDFVRVWPALSASGSSRNVTQVSLEEDTPEGAASGDALLVRRWRRDGGLTDLVEDRFVIGLLRGLLLHLETAHNVDRACVLGEADCRTWRLALASVVPSRATGRRWGATGDFSTAVLHVLAARGAAVGLAEVAADLTVSARTLQRRLAAEGSTFQDVRRRSRLATAARAVAGGTTLTQAAHAAGFADSAHLSRDFRRLVGLRPLDWSRLTNPDVARSFKPDGALPT
jgi:AraC-like DNA-binding protein